MLLVELYSLEEARDVMNELRQMFSALGFQIGYGRHALERLLGRDKEITKEEMLETFRVLTTNYKKPFRQMNNRRLAAMIIRDAHNKGNYVLNFRDNVATIETVMKKAGFKNDDDRQNAVIVDLPRRNQPNSKKKKKKNT